MADTEFTSPFDQLVGTQIASASGSRVVATVAVRSDLHQPAGLLHGGVHCTVVESLASWGAHLWLGEQGLEGTAVGVSNHTDFLRAVRDGQLTFEATPLHQGRRMQTWQVDVSDEQGRRVAHGKVKLATVRL